MADYLAIDIALIPPKIESDKIINLVKYFDNGPTKLNPTDCLPHITLAMGIIERTKLNLAFSLIEDLAKNTNEIPISIRGTNTFTLPNLTKISELIIEPNLELLKLHEKVMKEFKDLLTNDNIQLDYFLSPPEVSTQSIYWVQNYFDHHKSIGDYKPHITLGKGILDKLPRPIKFSCYTIALCHLGTYCTVRNILYKSQ